MKSLHHTFATNNLSATYHLFTFFLLHIPILKVRFHIHIVHFLDIIL